MSHGSAEVGARTAGVYPVTVIDGLQHVPLREQIKQLILRRIFDGEYQPGQRLVESRLAREFGVSQTSVREALRDLDHLSCVVHEPRRGCSVRAVSTEELLEAYPVRAALEALAAAAAAARIDDDDLARLHALVEAMRACADTGDRREQARLNADFHKLVVHASGNQILIRQWSLLEPYARTYLTTVSAADLWYLADRHSPILEMLERHDSEGAAAAIREHLLEAARILGDSQARSSSSAARSGCEMPATGVV